MGQGQLKEKKVVPSSVFGIVRRGRKLNHAED